MPRRNHDLMLCECGSLGCMICDGGLRVCKACLCIEGAWTSECPGESIPAPRLDEVYVGKVDFVDGRWKPQTSPNSLAGLVAQAEKIRKRKEAQVAWR